MNNVDKKIYNAPTVKDSIKLASETPKEEAELMLLQEALQDEDYRKWKKRNPGGSFKDYLEDFKPKRIKLSNGGSVEEYADLIDAYEKAFSCDTTSAFGGIIAVNQTLDEDTARKIVEVFTEVIIVPEITEGAKKILQEKNPI